MLMIESARLTPSHFEKISSIVYTYCGINLEPCKKIMLESRLNKRLRVLQLPSFAAYLELITSKSGMENELVHMIDAVTTNKTDFFREPYHFDFLREVVLPQFVQQETNRPFRVWSSACSTGEEPYTLAMVLQEFANSKPGFSYDILASDISTNVLQKASDAIYAAPRAIDIPQAYRKNYLLKSKDVSNPRVRIVPQLREKVKFARVNLTEPIGNPDLLQDAIFCRNVLIYFDRETQLSVIQNLLKKLKKGGMLFIGHSESLHFFDLPIRQIRPTIFIKN
jgi:chemotaxis protein methyltransferase CheR